MPINPLNLRTSAPAADIAQLTALRTRFLASSELVTASRFKREAMDPCKKRENPDSSKLTDWVVCVYI